MRGSFIGHPGLTFRTGPKLMYNLRQIDTHSRGLRAHTFLPMTRIHSSLVRASTLRLLAFWVLLTITAVAAPGDLDGSFGSGGEVVTPIGSGNDEIRSIALQGDGKIVAAGTTFTGARPDIVVARYDQNGGLDHTFNVTGKAIVSGFSGGSETRAVALQSDGKIVVVGYTAIVDNDIALVRYNTDGTLDSSFNGNGLVAVDYSSSDLLNAVAVQDDGKIVAAGVTISGGHAAFLVVRYNSDGTKDTGFGANGKLVTAVGGRDDFGRSVLLQSDGKIVVAGDAFNGSDYDFAVVRYTSAGAVDTSFGNGGATVTPIGSSYDHGYCAAFQGDGKILIAGTSGNGNDADFALARYTAGGVLDSTFGTGGRVTTAVASGSEEGFGLAVQGDGKIIVAGYSVTVPGSRVEFAIVRYLSTGALDSGFGAGGKVTTRVGGSFDFGRSLAIQTDGKMVVAGSSANGSNDDFALVRYFGVPEQPSVSTGATSAITKAGATLAGAVNPNGSATTAFFQYGTSGTYGSGTAGQSIGGGAMPVGFQASLTGLEPNTLYHYRLVASNGIGTTFGEDATFSTMPDPPVAATGNPAVVSSSSATLTGAVNPNGRATTVRFEYGTTSLYGISTPVQNIPAGTTVVDVSAPITGLLSGGTYHCRIVAMNAGGTAMGEDVSFAATSGGGGSGGATAKPAVSTGVASAIEQMGVTLGGTVNPNGGTTLAQFEYGTTSAYGSTSAPQGLGNGTTDAVVSVPLTGLLPGTTYHFRLVASNSLGTTTGDDATFTTKDAPPTVSSVLPTGGDLGATFVTLRGMVNPNRVSTTAIFSYDTSPDLQNAKTVLFPGSLIGSSGQSVAVKLKGLSAETTYHFRVTAASSAGTTSGDVLSFKTLGAQDPIAVDDHLYVGVATVALDVLANDVNADTEEVGTAAELTWDGVVAPPKQGELAGGPVVSFDPFGARGSFPLSGDQFSYRVKSPAGRSAVGKVFVHSYAAYRGSYGGAITGGAGDAGGALTIELSLSGGFTGQLTWQRKGYGLRGALDGVGKTSFSKPKQGTAAGTDLQISLALQPTGLILGELQDEESGKTYVFTLRNASGNGTDAQPGIYTAHMDQAVGALSEEATTGPQAALSAQAVTGFGYTLARLSKAKNGVRSSRFIGKVPDTEAFTSGSKVFAERALISSKLYNLGRNRFGGSLTGEATFVGGLTLASVLEWVKTASGVGSLREDGAKLAVVAPRAMTVLPPLFPDGFSNGLVLAGDRYPATGPSAALTFAANFGTKVQVEFSEGDLGSGVTKVAQVEFQLSGSQIVSRPQRGVGLEPITFKVVASQGFFSGTFTHPDTATFKKPVRFAGIFRKYNGAEEGKGSFRGKTNAGFVKVLRVQ